MTSGTRGIRGFKNVSALGDEDWVLTVPDAIELLLREGANVVSVSLDNDLGIPGSENEGFRVTQFLEQRAAEGVAAPPAEMKAHSANPVRAQEMRQAFANARRYWDARA